MRFGFDWIGFKNQIRNPIQSIRFIINKIQSNPNFCSFDRFSVWIELDLNTPNYMA